MKAVLIVICIFSVLAMAALEAPRKFHHGEKAGLRAPQIVYSVTVRNKLNEEIIVTVNYKKVVSGETLEEQQSIQAGSSFFFNSKTYEEGLAKYSYVIENVKASCLGADGEAVSISSPFRVNSPTANYVVVVEKDNESGQMTIHHAPKIEDI